MTKPSTQILLALIALVFTAAACFPDFERSCNPEFDEDCTGDAGEDIEEVRFVTNYAWSF